MKQIISFLVGFGLLFMFFIPNLCFEIDYPSWLSILLGVISVILANFIVSKYKVK